MGLVGKPPVLSKSVLQVAVDDLKNPRRQLMLFHQMPELHAPSVFRDWRAQSDARTDASA